jgi:hypothetical protein
MPTKQVIRFICLFIFGWQSTFAIAQVTAQWIPPSITWFCDEKSSGVTVCSLVARGDEPANIQDPITATATYRILKGRTIGAGPPLLTSSVTMPCSRLSGGILECRADNEVSLAPGILPAYGVSPNTTQLNVYSNTATRLFDWDGDGLITADKEGLMVLRFLQGFRGTGVSSGIVFTNGKLASNIDRDIGAGLANGWFNFIDTSQRPISTRDGLLFSRCLRGLSGASLVGGVSGADANAVFSKCGALTAIE